MEWIWNRTRPRAFVQSTQLISIQKTSPKHNKTWVAYNNSQLACVYQRYTLSWPFATVPFSNLLALGKLSMPDTVNSVVTRNILGNGNCDSLKWYLWKQGLKKPCLVRLSTNVNNISVEQAGRQLKNPKTKKKELMVEKKRDLDLEQIGEGVGNGSKWGEWLNILAIATHGKQIKTQVKRKIRKYPLSQVWKYCLKIMPPNQTTSSGYRAINK